MKYLFLLCQVLFISFGLAAQAKDQESETIDITSEAIYIDYSCFYYSSSKGFLIKKRNQFSQIDFFRKEDVNCKKIKVPRVDFKKYFVIIYKGYTKGCAAPNVNAVILKKGNLIQLQLKVTKSGDCNKQQEFNYAAALPVEYESKKIKFEVEETILSE